MAASTLIAVLSQPVLAKNYSRVGVGLGRLFAKAPELIFPYVLISGVTYALTKDLEASLGMPFVIGVAIIIFQSCQA